MKKIKKAAAILAILMILLVGCSAPEEAQDDIVPDVQEPSPEPAVTVSENVISPAVEPEPEPEPAPEQQAEPQKSPLEDFLNSDRMISSNPVVGSKINVAPRKVMLVFNYPVIDGSDVKVYDKTGTKRFDKGETIIADEEGVVIFTYVENMVPGTYLVVYKAIFPTKEGKTESEGYYHFELE